jgi:hypothetical protein
MKLKLKDIPRTAEKEYFNLVHEAKTTEMAIYLLHQP